MSLHPQHPPSPFASIPTLSPSRKRPAAEPIPFTFSPESPHGDKRRRPNLANGFSSLSLDAAAQRRENLTTPPEEVSSDGSISPTRYKREVSVEEVPDNRPFWSVPNHATASHSSNSSSTSDEDSDATFRQFRRPKTKRKHEHAQQADSVTHPDDRPLVMDPDVDVQDMSDHSPVRPGKRREHEEEQDEVPRSPWKRRREGPGGMDLDMNMEGNEEIEEIPRGSRPRTRTEWYEPEKDRIVITSIGSPNSSRSSSRSPSPTRRELAQPGQQGFTLSPSLLTHLLNSQRNDMYTPQQASEKGLVLYRPLGIDPDVVRTWQGEPALGRLQSDDHRFEEIDDDEVAGDGMDVDEPEPMDMS